MKQNLYTKRLQSGWAIIKDLVSELDKQNIEFNTKLNY